MRQRMPILNLSVHIISRSGKNSSEILTRREQFFFNINGLIIMNSTNISHLTRFSCFKLCEKSSNMVFGNNDICNLMPIPNDDRERGRRRLPQSMQAGKWRQQADDQAGRQAGRQAIQDSSNSMNDLIGCMSVCLCLYVHDVCTKFNVSCIELAGIVHGANRHDTDTDFNEHVGQSGSSLQSFISLTHLAALAVQSSNPFSVVAFYITYFFLWECKACYQREYERHLQWIAE
jgi:hypothetical protein